MTPVIEFTEEIWRNAEYAMGMSPWQIANKAIEIAMAEQPLITAEEAWKLGAGNAEYRYQTTSTASRWSPWFACTKDWVYREPLDNWHVQYRAIKQDPLASLPDELIAPVAKKELGEWIDRQQPEPKVPQWPRPYPKPEPAEPHAQLKAMYEQQAKDGTWINHIWACKRGDGEWTNQSINSESEPSSFEWLKNFEYRCTPKPTCQVRNLDTGELKTMTREAAKLLQAELGDTVEWWLGSTNMSEWETLDFNSADLYTYKQKANPVKLNGKLMSRDAAWREISLSDKDLYFRWNPTNEWAISEVKSCGELNNHNFRDCEYELRPKPLKQVSWKDVPVGVIVNCVALDGDFKLEWVSGKNCQITQDGQAFYPSTSALTLAPADQQPWIAVQDGESGGSVAKALSNKGIVTELAYGAQKYRVTGIAEGWELK